MAHQMTPSKYTQLYAFRLPVPVTSKDNQLKKVCMLWGVNRSALSYCVSLGMLVFMTTWGLVMWPHLVCIPCLCLLPFHSFFTLTPALHPSPPPNLPPSSFLGLLSSTPSPTLLLFLPLSLPTPLPSPPPPFPSPFSTYSPPLPSPPSSSFSFPSPTLLFFLPLPLPTPLPSLSPLPQSKGQYRPFVLHQLPWLVVLDRERVTPQEKVTKWPHTAQHTAAGLLQPLF